MLVFFTNLSLIGFQFRYLALFLISSVIDGFEWFWMESLHKNIQLMLEFLRVLFLVQHFSCYTLMTFLMVLSVILLSMLILILSTVNVIRHLIFGNNWNWLQNLNLIYEILLAEEWKDLLISMPKKTQLVLFDWSNKNDAIDAKMYGSVLEEKSSFKMLGVIFSSKLDLGYYFISNAKTASKEIVRLLGISLKSFIRPCLEYCCRARAGAPSCCLELLDKLQKRICRTLCPSLGAFLEPLTHRWNVASLNLFHRY